MSQGDAPSLPPLTAEFETNIDPMPGKEPPRQVPWKFLRASDGKTLVDYGNRCIITDPQAQQAVLLNRESKEATVIPLIDPSAAQQPSSGKPRMSPPVAPTNVQDLGKRMLLGHEVEGKRYTFPPVMPPPPPEQDSAPPGEPPPPQTMEVWTATKLHMPLFSRTVGVLGKQTTLCRNASLGEPPPAAFQIPKQYKIMASRS